MQALDHLTQANLALALLLQDPTDECWRRRLICRLRRPRLAGRPHRKRRLARMVGAVLRARV